MTNMLECFFLVWAINTLMFAALLSYEDVKRRHR